MNNTLIISTLLLSASAYADTLSPFISDGCSAFPDGTFQQNELWLSCCHQHDLAYWKGGSYQDRIDADFELKSCVSKIGEPEIALLMLAGVRVGGTPFLYTKFRWGYGWPYPKFYGELTPEEKQQVKDQVDQLELLQSPYLFLKHKKP
jgi:hypothetical protein